MTSWCTDCGAELLDVHPLALRCEECKRRAKNDYQNRWRARNRDATNARQQAKRKLNTAEWRAYMAAWSAARVQGGAAANLPWTQQDDRAIMADTGRGSAARLARDLGRSQQAIYARRTVLRGRAAHHTTTEAEDTP